MWDPRFYFIHRVNVPTQLIALVGAPTPRDILSKLGCRGHRYVTGIYPPPRERRRVMLLDTVYSLNTAGNTQVGAQKAIARRRSRNYLWVPKVVGAM